MYINTKKNNSFRIIKVSRLKSPIAIKFLILAYNLIIMFKTLLTRVYFS